MKKTLLLTVVLSLTAVAAELPPVIPAGPISYDDVSYAPATETPAATAPATDFAPADAFGAATTATAATGATDTATATGGWGYAEPITPASSSEKAFELGVNLYTSNYQVRGMGVTDELSNHGWSSISASYTHPNRNLFHRGVQARVGGDFGLIWDAGDALGDTPKFDINAAVGKEIFPNLLVEAGYALHRGGLEGFMARHHNGAAFRVAQDFNLSLTFNDHQRGFFGHIIWGYGIQGLKGHFFDIEAGYRVTDVLRDARANADVEISAGLAPSLGYWGAGVEGMDAYRVKVALVPYTHNGKLGRDGAWQLKPWVQVSWSGCNARKIDRVTGYGPVDHCQLTIGVEGGFKF